jgi:pimeloyl-ACP methyl ester carboxylesterase
LIPTDEYPLVTTRGFGKSPGCRISLGAKSLRYLIQVLIGSALLLSQISADRADPRLVSSGANLNTYWTEFGPSSTPVRAAIESHYTSQYVNVSGVRLHFVVTGSGRPVVLVHGNPGSALDWTRELDVMASRQKMLAFDRPGHGLSERPKHLVSTVEAQARMLHEALQQLRVERPILVGHSWGAALALVYAIIYPKEVSGVVLIAPAVYPGHDDDGFLADLPAVPVIGDAANLVLSPLLAASIARGKLKQAFSPDPVPKSYEKSALKEWTKPKKIKAYSVDEASLNDSLKRFSPRYSEITIPVTIITGDSDLIITQKDNAARLHEALPKSRLIIIPMTGHQIPITRPQIVTDEIDRVAKVVRASRP